MCGDDRRGFLQLATAGLALWPSPLSVLVQSLPGSDARRRHFIAEAERMRAEAVAAGDQAYGAVVVKDGQIVGWGPSRVVTDKDANAHGERVAIWDAQRRLGTRDLSGAMLFSTSLPCRACQTVAAAAGIARMAWGPDGFDAGAPRR